MDILDVGLTIQEFKTEWRLSYTPNDMKYWAPRLESEIPAEKACAVGMFEAWGKENVLKEYQEWASLREDCDSIIKDHKDKAKREHELYRRSRCEDNCYCYDCEEHTFVYRGTGSTSRRRMRHLSGNYTDYEKCQMDWPEYFNKVVKES